MFTLQDSIEINTTPEKLYDWFKNLDKNFTKWHQNHTKFTKLTGGMEEGDVVRFEERIAGKWFKFNLRIAKIEKSESGWSIEAKSSGATIILKAEKRGDKSVFSHIETFGFIKSKNAFVNNVIIPAIRKIINPVYRFDLIEKDIIEDNINLKKIFESTP